MIGRVKLGFLFVFLAVVHVNGEESLSVYENDAVQAQEYNHEYINVNKIFDKLHPHLHDLMMKLSMDPLHLIDISEPITKLPGKLRGEIDFSNGYMHGLPCVRRTQDVLVKYDDEILTLSMDLGWRSLDLNYQYRYEHLLIKRSGHAFGKFNNVDVNVRVKVDFKSYRIMLEDIKFMRVGDFQLTLGDNRGDAFLNGIIKLITKVFREIVLKHLQKESMKIFQGVLDEFNKKIPQPERMRLLENFDEMEFRNTFYRIMRKDV